MRCWCLLFSLGTMLFPALVCADYQFDADLLGEEVDPAVLVEGQPAGVYLVDVLLNGGVVDNLELPFERGPQGVLQTCLSKTQLLRYGIKVDEYPRLFVAADNNAHGVSAHPVSEMCADLAAIPDASVFFDFYNQQLRLSVPQLALVQQVRGIAPQALWDDGMTALLMNYRVSVNRSNTRSQYGSSSNEQWSASLEPGLNLGAWRLRNSSSWQPGEWQYAYTYAERGLNDWKSRLTLGERFSSSSVFDGVPLTGAMLATDDNMVPYEQRVYGPVVRGTARSQARIEIRQNGYLIFTTTVAPGPFEFTDLASGGAGGDLEVTVLETDGDPQVFTVTYATPAIALREGAFKYDVAAGHYRSASQGVEQTPLGQFSLMYGLPFGLTAYGGGQWSSHYHASALGAGASLGMLGAISIDASQASWQQQGREGEHGHKWRLLYSKYVEPTQSWFSLESNQYGTAGFRSMSEVLDSYMGRAGGSSDDDRWIARNATSVSLGQSLGTWGSLNLSGILTRYHDAKPDDKSLRLSYSGSFKRASVYLDWMNRYQGTYAGQSASREQQLGLRLSYPLSWGWQQPVYMSYQLRDSNKQPQQHEIGLQGSGFERRMHWDLREQRTAGSGRGGQDRSLLNLGWSGKYGVVNGGYGYSRDSQQMNANLAGGFILHQDGLTLGQPLGQTVGLVMAPDASDMAVGGWPGVRTDPRGYTTLGFLSPYQVNTVAVDPIGLPDDVTLSQTEIKVVPSSGAVIPVPFATIKGASGIIHLSRPDGALIPFGAVVVEDGETRTGMSVGIVGDEGSVYLSGLQDVGRLLVRWGSADDQQCKVDYRLPAFPSEFGGGYELQAVCQ
ncbi:fimbria/pilus outer membrane usher protein [Aeromonas salmonicida]